MKLPILALAWLLVVMRAPACAPPQPPPAVPTWTLSVIVRADHKPLADVLVDIMDGPSADRDGRTNAEGIFRVERMPQAGQTLCIDEPGFFTRCFPVTLTASMSVDIDLERRPPPPPIGRIAGRVRAENGILVNDDGPWVWRGRSDFDLLRLALNGDWPGVEARLDDAAKAKFTNVRVFAMAHNLFRLTPNDPGYPEALNGLLRRAADRSLYVNLCVFPDAQLLYPRHEDRRQILTDLLAVFGDNNGIIWELANEPWQNGWSSATDEKLLDLARLFVALRGHKDFIVGDPRDGDDPDASAETIAEARRLAEFSNLLALHSSRKGGANTDSERLRRWVDHLEGAYDIVLEARKINPRVFMIHIEPMGHASIQWVPLSNGRSYEREFDADVALAGAATALFGGMGYTYHRIAAQDPGTPGQDVIASTLADVPAGGDWRYRNDSWDGSATRGFSCQGKVRSYVNGQRGFVIAYGKGSHCSITWANGYRVTATRFRSDDTESGRLQESKVALYEVQR